MADRIPARALAARTTSPTSGTPDPIQLHATVHNALGTRCTTCASRTWTPPAHAAR